MSSTATGKRRAVIGVLVLFLPVSCYFLLRVWGENHYALPIYFEKPVSTNCVPPPAFPYTLFQHAQLQQLPSAPAYWLYLASAKRNEGHHQTVLKTLKGLRKEIDTAPHLIVMAADSLKATSAWTGVGRLSFVQLHKAEPPQVLSCVFLADHLFDAASVPDNVVLLLDGQGRIRGYFDPLRVKGRKTALVELKVLLSGSESLQ